MKPRIRCYAPGDWAYICPCGFRHAHLTFGMAHMLLARHLQVNHNWVRGRHGRA